MWDSITRVLAGPGGLVANPAHAVSTALFTVVLSITTVLSVVFVVVAAAVIVAGRARRRGNERGIDEKRLPRVTIQIPTFNELAALNCARRCLAFDYPPGKFEILIGDDSNDESVSARLKEFEAEHADRVKVLRRGTNAGYKAGNLNHMLQYSKGDYILVFDSDFLPEPDFLRRIAAPVVEDRDVMAVQAKWRIVNMNRSWATILGAGIICTIHELMLPFMRMVGSAVPLCGSAELVRKDELVRQGMWKSGALTEDIDYWCRLVKTRRRTVFLDALTCLCEVPQTSRDLFRQQMRWAYGVTRSFAEHGREMFMGKRIHWKTKAMAALFGSGYLMVACVIPLIVFGILSAFTDPGVTASVAASWRIAAVETLRSILFTGGLIIATICAGLVSGFGAQKIAPLVLASLTVGIALVVFVSFGICQAVAGRPMPWFMLKKLGNQQRL